MLGGRSMGAPRCLKSLGVALTSPVRKNPVPKRRALFFLIRTTFWQISLSHAHYCIRHVSFLNRILEACYSSMRS